jgi:hypothetical protein
MDDDDQQLVKQAAKSTGNWAVDWVVDKFKGLITLVVIMVVILIIAKLFGALPEDSHDESAGADPVVETTAPPAPVEDEGASDGVPPEEQVEITRASAECQLTTDQGRPVVVANTVDHYPATIYLEVEFADGGFKQVEREYPDEAAAHELMGGSTYLDDYGAAESCAILNVVPR